MSDSNDTLEERVARLERLLIREVKPVVDQFKRRFGYSMNKNCKSCGTILGASAKTPVKCPKCEKPTGYGSEVDAH